jgi:competence protein ComEA
MILRIAALTLFALVVLACSRESAAPSTTSKSSIVSLATAVNINTASANELQRIPHIGEKLAAKIIEHRETHGPFRRVEHLMLIQGISDKRFRKIRPMVRVE